jgi:prepilin-type N-terminal cleavage/methylation domain-containing protein
MKKYINVQGRKPTGFTIIELMVAVAVTALLVSLMLTITVNVMGGWSKSSGTLTAGNQARTILDQIERDLQSAILKRDGNVWFAATIQQNQAANGGDAGMSGDATWAVNAKPSGNIETDPTTKKTSFVIPAVVPPNTVPILEDYRFGQGGVWLRFISSVSDTNTATTISGPRAVAYQIVRLPVLAESSEVRYQLFRSEVGTNETFNAGYNLFSSVYNTATVPVALTDAAVVRRPEIAARDRQLVLANNVVDFGVRVFTRDATGVLKTTPSFPSSQYVGFAATTDTTAIPTPLPSSSPSLNATQISHEFPAFVEVFVRILTDEGATQIANLEATPPTITGDWWDIVLANSKVYTRRIEIKSTGL